MAVDKYLIPLGITRPTPGTTVGGYFIWLTLPPGLVASKIAQRAKDEMSLLIGEGPLFKVEGAATASGSFDTDSCPTNGSSTFVKGHDDLENYIRICFSYEDEDKLEEGVMRLAALIERADIKDGFKSQSC